MTSEQWSRIFQAGALAASESGANQLVRALVAMEDECKEIRDEEENRRRRLLELTDRSKDA